MTDDVRQKIFLRSNAGENWQEIGAELGLDAAIVERLYYEESDRLHAARRDPPPEPEATRVDVELALADPDLVEVSDSSVGAEIPDDQLLISFSDVFAHAFSDLVDSAVEMLRDVPGLQDPMRQDRELIVATNTGIEKRALEKLLAEWCRAQLRQLLKSGRLDT